MSYEIETRPEEYSELESETEDLVVEGDDRTVSSQTADWTISSLRDKYERGQIDLPSEERHEGSGEGTQALVESFQRPFTADGVAEERRHKVDHFIAPEAAAGKAHLLADGV